MAKRHKLRKIKVYDKKGTNFKKIKVYNKNSINFCRKAINYPAEGVAFGGALEINLYNLNRTRHKTATCCNFVSCSRVFIDRIFYIRRRILRICLRGKG